MTMVLTFLPIPILPSQMTLTPNRTGTWDIGADEVEPVCRFKYQRQITFKYSERGSTCGGSYDLSNFPVLINLSGDWLKTVANGGKIYDSDGYDIIFRDSNGNQLNHEIEKYDDGSGGGGGSFPQVASITPSTFTLDTMTDH